MVALPPGRSAQCSHFENIPQATDVHAPERTTIEQTKIPLDFHRSGILLLSGCPLRVGLSNSLHVTQDSVHGGRLAIVSGRYRPVVATSPLGSQCPSLRV